MTGPSPLPWHDAPWARIHAARAAGRMPHAILLTGPQGLGKVKFAHRLAAALVCTGPDPQGEACGRCAACRQRQAGSHPDLHVVQPAEPGKMIKIDAIRELGARSVLAAQEQGFRVFLIAPAEAMNRAAANALLKTLEEPASRVVLILVSSHADRLPATIRSRCQLLKFALPARETVGDWLAGQVADAPTDTLWAISGGAPLRARQAGEEGWLEADARLLGELASLRARQVNPLHIVEEWEKRPLTQLLDGAKRCLADLLRVGSGWGQGTLFHPSMLEDLQTLGQGIDLQLLHELYAELLGLERDLSHNLNTSMLFEHLINRWLQITRPGGH